MPIPSLALTARICSGSTPNRSTSSWRRRSGSAPGRSILLRTGMISELAIAVVMRVEGQRPERRVRLAGGAGNPRDDLLEQLGDADPFLGAHGEDLLGIHA